MKKFRLLVLALMLVGSVSMFSGSTTVYACADGGGCTGSDRPLGCACCSDNHCASGNCLPNDRCGSKKGEGIEIIQE